MTIMQAWNGECDVRLMGSETPAELTALAEANDRLAVKWDARAEGSVGAGWAKHSARQARRAASELRSMAEIVARGEPSPVLACYYPAE